MSFEEFRDKQLCRRGPPGPDGVLPKVRKFADRELLVMIGGDQENPELVWMHYDELAYRNRNRRRAWLPYTILRQFGNDPDLEQRCWLSDVQVYLVPTHTFEKDARRFPWACSKEHLVCGRNQGYGNGRSNLVLVGRYVNNSVVGHDPLPVKMLYREELWKYDYDRDLPTQTTAWEILKCVQDIQRPHKIANKFPWQPWAYDQGTREHRIATAMFSEMRALEEEFLAQDDEGRRQWLKEFRWKW